MKLNDNFSNIQEFENEIKNKSFFSLWGEFQDNVLNGLDYKDLTDWQEKFKPYGLTFDFGLDAQPFDFEIN